MNKWLNPPHREVPQEEFFSLEPTMDKPFEYYLEQVGKKKVLNSKRSSRVADKSVSLAARIGMQGDK